MSAFNSGGFSPRHKQTSTGESWWTDSPRLGFTANAAQRFVGCSFPSHKKPRAVFESTEDATMKRLQTRGGVYDPSDLPDLESVGIASDVAVESSDDSSD